MRVFKKLQRLYVRIKYILNIQSHPKYKSPQYKNTIELLKKECVGLSTREANKLIRNSFIYGRSNYSMITLIVKDNYRRRDGTLICRLCGREDLIDCQLTGFKPKGFIENIATIEHINPKSKGGLKFHPSNMTITCNKCNNERGTKEIIKVNELKYVIVD